MVDVLVDTGPLVALRSRRDAHHESCRAQLERMTGPLLTCWPVLTEACHLLRRKPDAVRALLGEIQRGTWLRVASLDRSFAGWAEQFFGRYGDREPQLADAALLWLAQSRRIETIFTLDRGDFSTYRLDDGRRLQLIPDDPRTHG